VAIASVKTVEKDRISEAVGYGRSMVEAELDARELRARVWTKQGPAGFLLPVDPFEIALDLGIKVVTVHGLSPDISGMLTKEAGYEDPKISLSALDSRNRHRFTCAHELGHYTQLVRSGQAAPWEYVDGRHLLSPGVLEADEVYANHFAAELLMPRDLVVDRMTGSNAAALALDFGVAGDAMRFRLDNLGLT
jgi:Zn-dependent peptidase ImmA (M78 family)